MTQKVNSKPVYDLYDVEFLLRFKGEDRTSGDPYHGSRVVELVKPEELKKAEQLQEELTQTLRKYFAGLNEFPVEIVLVELVKFERKDA
ncbi:MAG: hypothetical protein IJX99_10380 [Clostridia bacterium]|nr:hypothetical protein [Clostridia bacterium]